MTCTRLRKLVGFVPQCDLIISQLTVKENISHSARVRLPSSWTDMECDTHVNKLLSCLGLVHIQDTVVGDPLSSQISGGQRKRVSIGIELAAAPMVIFLDEPTSGLDSTNAFSIVRVLKGLSQLGVTVICIIHQPRVEILALLDGMYLLNEGYQIYRGQVNGMKGYFESLGFDISCRSNAADAVLDIISGHSDTYNTTKNKITAKQLANSSASGVSKVLESANGRPSPYSSMQETPSLTYSASIRGAPWFKQVNLCLVRSLRQQWRCKSSLVLDISVGAICGLLIGLSLYQLRGRHFQGIYLPPSEILSSAVNYTLSPQIGLLCSMAIG